MRLRALAAPAALALLLAPTALGGGTLKNTALPQITGTPFVGKVLTVSSGTWTGNPTAFLYQWMRCAGVCDPVGSYAAIGPPSTSNTYRLTQADAGHQLYVLVQATNGKDTTVATALPSQDVAEADGSAPPAPTGSTTTTTTATTPSARPVPPKARIALTPRGGTIEAFSAAPSYARMPARLIKSFLWQFGDGRKATGMTTAHRYAKPGRYTVTLTVKDDLGHKDSAKLVVHVG